MAEVEKGSGPPAVAPGPLAEKASESSTLRGSVPGRQDEELKEQNNTAKVGDGQSASQPSVGTST
jgi:hypothetical protein